MAQLCLINCAILAVLAVVLILLRKVIKTERGEYVLFLVASLATVACHYSSLVYHALTDGAVLDYLTCNPNLLLPIYPCNVVMWCCVVYGFLPNKTSRTAAFCADFAVWFGTVSALVGMFANVDFIRNPNLADYDITKGILAHGLMLGNSLCLIVFRKVKLDLLKNLRHILESMLLMFLLGNYCNLLARALVSEDCAKQFNSMFLLFSPFEGLPFLKFPLICACAALLYFAVFHIAELFRYPRGARWWNRLRKR